MKYNELISIIKQSNEQDWTFVGNDSNFGYYIINNNDLDISIEITELEEQPIKKSYPPYEKIYKKIDPSVHGEEDIIYRDWFNIKYKSNIIKRVIIITHDFGHRPYVVDFPFSKREYNDFQNAIMRIVNLNRKDGFPLNPYIQLIEDYLQSEEFTT